MRSQGIRAVLHFTVGLQNTFHASVLQSFRLGSLGFVRLLDLAAKCQVFSAFFVKLDDVFVVGVSYGVEEPDGRSGVLLAES